MHPEKVSNLYQCKWCRKGERYDWIKHIFEFDKIHFSGLWRFNRNLRNLWRFDWRTDNNACGICEGVASTVSNCHFKYIWKAVGHNTPTFDHGLIGSSYSNWILSGKIEQNELTEVAIARPFSIWFPVIWGSRQKKWFIPNSEQILSTLILFRLFQISLGRETPEHTREGNCRILLSCECCVGRGKWYCERRQWYSEKCSSTGNDCRQS